ncbi:MAG TPA: glycerol-3-phosphate dehydrogenase C-terminal domain-containing protein, partial [Chitinophagales bacterium]|nr:glycerol-3-phosphate dehydrogenase C-terminal domain-containing protein [Chitinophagales bacterium]
IAKIVAEDDTFQKKINETNYTAAEIIFYIRHQHVVRISDVLTRRTSLTYQMKDFDDKLVQTVAQLMANELNWSVEELDKQVSLYRSEWKLMHAWQ